MTIFFTQCPALCLFFELCAVETVPEILIETSNQDFRIRHGNGAPVV